MGSTRWAGRLFLGLGLAALILAQGCPADKDDHPGVSRLKITDNSGRATAAVGVYDSLMVSLSGVEPRTHYNFVVTPAGASAPIVGQARLSTDQQGNLPPAILLYDVGQGSVPAGSYDIEVTGPDIDVTTTIDVEPRSEPYLYTCDDQGVVKNTFDYGDPLYVQGANFLPNAEVHLIPLADRSEYRNGDDISSLNDPTGGQGRYATNATTDANGLLPLTQLINFVWFGMAGDGFDIVADLDPFDVYNTGQDAADGHSVVGATYQVPDVGTDIDSQLACDSDGTYLDTFGTQDDVYVFINPPLQYVIQHGWVEKYVCNHQDEWLDGDPLQDVSGGDEMDGVQSGCTNEQIVIIFPGPLPPGDYDVIIDINKDGSYTQGVDIVDGGSAESVGQIGFTVN